jgi:hypothetical protein
VVRKATCGVFGVMTATSAVMYACVGNDDVAQQPDASNDATSQHDTSGDAATVDVTAEAEASAPPPVTRTFLSSMKYYGDSIGGVTQADSDCQLLATAASRGSGWKAWLSSSTSNAKDRIVLGNGSITLVDGLTVVVNHGTDVLGDGGLLHAIDHDENGSSVAPSLVWTGTTQFGVVYAAAGPPCGDWTSPDGGASAGGSNQTGVTWTSDGTEPCTTAYPIYCFGP